MVVTLPETLEVGSLTVLAEQLEAAEGAVVLEGGEVFCRGMDLSGGAGGDAIAPFLRVVSALRAGPAAIAYVDGEARGAGVGLAAVCDLVIASPRASFGLSELWFGLWPAAIHPLLVERVSAARLRWMAISARTLDAEQARAWGLVDDLGGRDLVDAALAAAGRAEPEAIRRYKAMTAPLDAVAEGARATAERLGDPEVQRRLRAFSEGFVPWA